MAKKDLIFGLEVNKDQKRRQQDATLSFSLPGNDDGSMMLPAEGYGNGPLSQSFVLSLDAGVASEAELIEKYRTMALYPQADMAIEEICNEAIVSNQDEPVVKIDLSDVPKELVGEATKEKIRKSFEDVVSLLRFKRDGYKIFRRWYIDSRVAYHKIVDGNNVKGGIKEIRPIDPRKLKRVKEIQRENRNGVEIYKIVNEYYVYIESATLYNKTFAGPFAFGDATYAAGKGPPLGQGAVKVSLDAVSFAHSGLVDPSSGVIYGHLQKAIKPFNQLRMLEDAIVIYRLARASERRIFYVDTGTLPPAKAEFYVKQLQNRMRSKITYDATTGEIADKRRVMSLQEDFWLPRREGSRGTEISTIGGAQNLGQIQDVEYFRDELWHCLNVPPSRFTSDGASAMFGVGGNEISREEMKFAKFVNRLRAQFSELFSDLLKTQLILTGVLKEEEWEDVSEFVRYVYASDEHYAQIRDAQIWAQRFSNLAMVDPFVGRYVPRKWVYKNVLMMTDDEMEEMKKDLAAEAQEEIKNPRLANPAHINSPFPQMFGFDPPPQDDGK